MRYIFKSNRKLYFDRMNRIKQDKVKKILSILSEKLRRSRLCSFIIIFYLFILVAPEGFSRAQITVASQAKIDFGSYPAKEAKESKFIIMNNGDSDLTILGIRITCDCSTVSISSKSIKPGKSAILKLKVKGNSIEGTFRRKIYIISNGAKNKITELSFSGNAVPLYIVEPGKEWYIGSMVAGSALKQELTIITKQDGVVLGKPVVFAEFPLKADMVKKSENEYALSLTAIKVNSKNPRFNIKVIIPIQKPKGWSPIEIMLRGRIAREQ